MIESTKRGRFTQLCAIAAPCYLVWGLAVWATSMATIHAQAKGPVRIKGEQRCGGLGGYSNTFRVNVNFTNGKSGAVWLREFDTRFRLSTFFGEPVEVWNFRYLLGGKLFVGSELGSRISVLPGSAPNDVVKARIVGQSVVIEVSRNLWELITIEDLKFVATTRRLHAFHGSVPGILGKSGKWGWDLPGSPEWNRLFTSMTSDLPATQRTPDNASYLSAADAKMEWRKLREDAGKNPNQVFRDVRVYDVKVSLVDFIARIETLKPGATRYLMKPCPADVSEILPIGSDQTLREKSTDEQIDALIRSYAREGNKSGLAGRREKAIAGILAGLGSAVSEARQRQWQAAKLRRWRLLLGTEIAKLGQRVETEWGKARGGARPELSISLQRDLKAYGKRIAAYGDQAPRQMVDLWDRLALFAKGRGQAGFGSVPVATWQHAFGKGKSAGCSAIGIGGAPGEDKVLVVHRVREVQSTNPNHGSHVYNKVHSLHGVDLRSGKTRWSTEIGINNTSNPSFLLPDGEHLISHPSSNYRRPYRYSCVWRLADGVRLWGGRRSDINTLPRHLRPLTKTEYNSYMRFFFPELDRYVDMPSRPNQHDIVCRSLSSGQVLWQQRHVGNWCPDDEIKQLGRRFFGFQFYPKRILRPIGHTVLDVTTGKVALELDCGPPTEGARDRYRDGMETLGKNSSGPFSRRFDSRDLQACPTTADGKYLAYDTKIRELASGRVVAQLGPEAVGGDRDARFLLGDRHLLNRNQIWLLPDLGGGNKVARLVAEEGGRVVVSTDGSTVVFFGKDEIRVYR